MLQTRLLSRPRRPQRSHILRIRNTRLRQSRRRVDRTDGEEFQAAGFRIAGDGYREDGVCDGDFFAARVEDDVFAGGDNEEGDWGADVLGGQFGGFDGGAAVGVKVFGGVPVVVEEGVLFALGFEFGEFC